jgi:GTP-binding protein
LIDQAEIEVKSGDGGRGVATFRHEKYVPRGGPDGGDGGKGGDVIIEADKDIGSLMKYRHQRIFKAKDGASGQGQKKTGKSGEDVVINLPVGTIIRDKDTGEVLADLSQDGERVVAARGGKGGLGNPHFAGSTNQAPRLAQIGVPGETRMLTLELKLIADAGIVGLPNAGKSSLLAAISAARPKVADYPFTTLEPALGVVEAGGRRWVVADVPGLIEGAHLGKGLGLQFLRHVARTHVLVHVVDGSSTEPVNDMVKINTELMLYDPLLAKKQQIVVINKIDLSVVKSRIPILKEMFKAAGYKAYFISAATGEGVDVLLAELDRVLKEPEPEAEVPEPLKVFRPRPQREQAEVTRDSDGYHLLSDEYERLVAGSELNDAEVRRQVLSELWRWGAQRALKASKIQPGEKLFIGKAVFYW